MRIIPNVVTTKVILRDPDELLKKKLHSGEPQRRVDTRITTNFYRINTNIRGNPCIEVKRGNLYAEQGQINPDLGIARSYCVLSVSGWVGRIEVASNGNPRQMVTMTADNADLRKLNLADYADFDYQRNQRI